MTTDTTADALTACADTLQGYIDAAEPLSTVYTIPYAFLPASVLRVTVMMLRAQAAESRPETFP